MSNDLNFELEDAIKSGDVGAFERLLELGANIDAGDSLAWCISEGHVDWTKRLLLRGADPSRALLVALASSSSKLALAKLVLQFGADPNVEDDDGLTPLFFACGADGSFEGAQMLLAARADPNHTSFAGDTPLIWAAYQRDWRPDRSPISELASFGADLNYVNQVSGSGAPTAALVGAARFGRSWNVEVLLSLGADPNVRDFYGSTPLLEAVSSGRLDIVETLVRHGADKRLRDTAGMSSIERAQVFSRQLIWALEH